VTPTDKSYGRYPNGSETFSQFDYPTPIANNDLAGEYEEIKIVTPLKAFPNPATDFVYLNKAVAFNLYNLQGQLVLSQSKTQQVAISQLRKGVYILRTEDQETVRIVIQ
jgi:hypothetical protein